MNDNKFDPWFNMIPNSALEELANPIAHEIGQGLGGIASLIFNPARKIGIISRKNIEDFEEKIYSKTDKIPQENRDNSKQGLALKALEDSAYQLESDDLREMFSNLISSTLDNSKNDKVHPSFSSLLKDMSSSDAKLFNIIYRENQTPITSVKAVKNNTNDYIYLSEFNLLLPDNKIVSDKNESIDLLKRLGLISILDKSPVISEQYLKRYENYEKSSHFEAIKSFHINSFDIKREFHLSLQRGHIKLTHIGKAFGDCVINDQ